MSWVNWLAAVLLCASTSVASLVQRDSFRDTPPQPIRIYFSALDKTERPVLGLQAADFRLRIDGKIAPLQSFQSGLATTDRSIPLVAWILIDFNPNIKEKVIQQQADAAGAIFQMLHPESVLGVKLVSDRSETLAPLTHDAATLRGAFTHFGERRLELRAGAGEDAVVVGAGGIARALELAMGETDSFVAANPAFHDREMHRAVLIISDGNLNPSYNLRRLYATAAQENVFLYPIFVPRAQYGPWVRDYFDLARKTAGVASVFGALKPGAEVLPLPRSNEGPNALTVNFIHMIRDVNGKYSFTIPQPPDGRKARLELECKVSAVRIRLVRKTLP